MAARVVSEFKALDQVNVIGMTRIHCGHVLVHGQRADLVAAPSAEHARIDLTGIPSARHVYGYRLCRHAIENNAYYEGSDELSESRGGDNRGIGEDPQDCRPPAG